MGLPPSDTPPCAEDFLSVRELEAMAERVRARPGPAETIRASVPALLLRVFRVDYI
jgi:hypothetical protein